VHVLVAPDKFKGSLSAVEVAARVTAGLRSVVPDVRVVQLPVADGGDGTVDAAVAAGFERVPVSATGPLGGTVHTSYARRGDVAVVELASTCGLQQLPVGRIEPMRSSSIGLGEVIGSAIGAGCRRLVIGVGGSASTDGGAGMLHALGARILDRAGNPVETSGAGLRHAESLDLAGLDARLHEVEIEIASDVNNPLYGPRGAAMVYGPQKGATGAQVALLDHSLRSWARLVAAATGRDHAQDAGAGAAGGVGFAALAVLAAVLRPGIDVVLELSDLRRHLPGCRLVVTGEGWLDEQTLAGKAPVGVAAAALAAGVPTVAVAGGTSLGPDELRAAGISQAYVLSGMEPDRARCMAHAGPLLERISAVLAGDWLADEARSGGRSLVVGGSSVDLPAGKDQA
jgi:glycerate 2-kinase